MRPSLSDVYNHVIKHFKYITYSTFLYFFYAFIGFFGLMGIYLIITTLITAITPVPPEIIISLLAFLIAIFLTFHSGIKSSLLYHYYKTVKNSRPHLLEFLRVALDRSPKALIIGLLRIFVTSILLAPLLLVYFYVPLLQDNIIFYIIGGIYTLLILLITSYVFSLPFFILSLTGKLRRSLVEGLSLAFKKFVIFFPSYVLYALSVLIGFIPIINILTLILLYPFSSLYLMLNINEVKRYD